MKQALVVICIAILMLFITRCTEIAPWSNEKADIKMLVIKVEEIQYIKDPRTGICFAFVFRGGFTPSIATVSREAVPPQLLYVAVQ